VSNVLLRFLANGLIDVGGDDAKLEKLRVAANDLAASLKKSPSKATAYALVAFDPHAPADDPVVIEALEFLKKRWITYVNTFASTPVAVVRAMLLDALSRAAEEDDRIGVAFVASARNALPHMEAGNEQAIWEEVVTQIENRVDARAEAEWATPSSISISAMVVDIPDLSASTVRSVRLDRDELVNGFRAAAGSQFQDPSTNAAVATGGNRYMPHSNPLPWVADFGEHLAEAVAQSIETVSDGTTIEQADLSGPLRTLASNVSSHVESAVNAMAAATAGLQRRTNLLWWKEARFSPTARVNYRDLPPQSAATLMAFDLHKQVPLFCPASVPAFLAEAVLGLPTIDPIRTYAVRELVANAQAEVALVGMRSGWAELVPPREGRGPIMAIAADPESHASGSESEFRRLTGMSLDTKLTLPEWASWVFRELEAARATNEGASVKRRQRKA